MAPYEANTQLPWLPRLDPIMGGVSAGISKDNDLIAYGCPALGTNGSSSQSLLDCKSSWSSQGNGGGICAGIVSSASYAVPLESARESSFITRPLAEILRDMNKRVPEKVLKVKNDNGASLKYIPWYHANRMLSFYAPGWSGEIRSITFAADSSTVTVVYRVTIRGSDGEAWRESSGTASVNDIHFGDPVQKAEGMAFRRACARFGLGLYLYHEDEVL
ncbi:unnamed protein product [Sphagnum balticum]